MKRRVVITGLGTVSPIGCDVATMWNNAISGVSGVSPLTRVDASKFPMKVAAEVSDFDPTQFMDKKEARKMDRFTQFAVAASLMALEDADLKITDEIAPRVGVWIGSGIGGMETYEQQFRTFEEKGYRRVSPFFVPMMIPDMASGQVSIVTGAKGINSCTVTACASGTNSIGDAFKVIQRGDADFMITGGAEAPITDMAVADFSAAKAISTSEHPKTASRPFDSSPSSFPRCTRRRPPARLQAPGREARERQADRDRARGPGPRPRARPFGSQSCDAAGLKQTELN